MSTPRPDPSPGRVEPPRPLAVTNIVHQYDDGMLQPVDRSATIEWPHALEALRVADTCWLTVQRDRGPHTRPVLCVVADGALFTTSSPGAVKARALSAGAPCSVAATADGIHLVWAGASRHVIDPAALEQVAAAYHDLHGWDVHVDDGAFVAPYGAPTAGPPPYKVFCIDPATVHAFGTTEALASRSTRWDFTPVS